MAHELETMAYVGQTPWHGLGNALPAKQPIEVWAQQAGMDWSICETPVRFVASQQDKGNEAVKVDSSEETSTAPALGTIHSFDNHKVLYRSDTKSALSVVSKRYQVVQPREILEFYRDLSEVSGFELETAGVLKEGRKFWALARTGKEARLKGGDVVKGYLLLATSCDGTLATTATPTSVRVVCNNTLSIAINGASTAVKVPHSTSFDAEAVKRQLGVAVSHWDEFMYQMKQLSQRKVKDSEAASFFKRVLSPMDGGFESKLILPDSFSPAKAEEEFLDLASMASIPESSSLVASTQAIANERALKKVQALYDGNGRGAELDAAKGSAWGLLSAITEFVDHERRARSQEFRLDSAWFGQGAAVKQRALEQALLLAS